MSCHNFCTYNRISVVAKQQNPKKTTDYYWNNLPKLGRRPWRKKTWEEEAITVTQTVSVFCPAQRCINSVSMRDDHQSQRGAVLTAIHLTDDSSIKNVLVDAD